MARDAHHRKQAESHTKQTISVLTMVQSVPTGVGSAGRQVQCGYTGQGAQARQSDLQSRRKQTATANRPWATISMLMR